MITFILADLRRFWSGALAVVVLIALSVALSVTVTLQERAVRLGSARAAEKFDLLVGPPAARRSWRFPPSSCSRRHCR